MPIELDVAGDVALVTLFGPDGNRLDSPTINELADVIDGVAERTDLGFVILNGHGETFCRGRVPTPGLTDEASIRSDLQPVVRLSASLDRVKAVVVAAVEGAALGLGFGLAVQADHAVVGSDAALGFPEIRHGIPPLLVISYLTRHLPYKHAFDLAASGREIAPPDAREWGLVNDVVTPGTAIEAAHQWVEELRRFPVPALVLLRQFTRTCAGLSDDQLMESGAAQIAAYLNAARAADA